jgi:hypothetical protein
MNMSPLTNRSLAGQAWLMAAHEFAVISQRDSQLQAQPQYQAAAYGSSFRGLLL